MARKVDWTECILMVVRWKEDIDLENLLDQCSKAFLCLYIYTAVPTHCTHQSRSMTSNSTSQRPELQHQNSPAGAIEIGYAEHEASTWFRVLFQSSGITNRSHLLHPATIRKVITICNSRTRGYVPSYRLPSRFLPVPYNRVQRSATGRRRNS